MAKLLRRLFKVSLSFTVKFRNMNWVPLVSIFLATATAARPQHVNHADSATGITIHQEVYFGVAPEQLYQTLLSAEKFSACTKKSFDMFTASSAHIDAMEGGLFSLFDGHIVGRILELVPGRRIVEAWRVVDWPEGVYSIARFELKPQGPGTQLIFDHVGFPEGLKEHLASGWQQHYWDALGRYFQGK
jgi:activator of HSP90 ATPase